jgi:hypothetical protein
MRRREANQSSFFDSGQHLDAQSRFLLNLSNKIISIVGFTKKRSRDRGDVLRPVTFGDGTKTFQAINRSHNRRVADVLVKESFLAQPDDLTLTRELRERVAAGSFNYHEFN